jgi:endonuclease YncB( thermonuclease family)
MCWWWRKVRKAQISDDLRTRFERFGENLLAQGLANPAIGEFTGEFLQF